MSGKEGTLGKAKRSEEDAKRIDSLDALCSRQSAHITRDDAEIAHLREENERLREERDTFIDDRDRVMAERDALAAELAKLNEYCNTQVSNGMALAARADRLAEALESIAETSLADMDQAEMRDIAREALREREEGR